MTFSRIFLVVALVLFGGIALVAVVKKQKRSKLSAQVSSTTPAAQMQQAGSAAPSASHATMVVASAVGQAKPIEIDLGKLQATVDTGAHANVYTADANDSRAVKGVAQEKTRSAEVFKEVDKIELLFQKNSPLPIVETIQYKSRVSWKRGRAAWLVDYASHYKTHLHFIARSLNGRPDYNPKPAREGETFTILSQDQDFRFHLVIDISRCRLWLYYVLPQEEEYALLKTYRVGLGRVDPKKSSGSLTPTGKYSLGSRIAVYQPKMMGTHRGQKVEMIRVFGTRWIPFEKELGNCSEPAKGYGIHGTPFKYDEANGVLVDNPDSIGKYESDGCIRLRAQDIEELFAIISTHETIVEIVNDFSQAKLPGKEILI
jgi:hypothetical protein